MSDYRLFERFQSEEYETCHILHYLQMATEKLTKAYLWRSGIAPRKFHIGLTQLLPALLDRPEPELDLIAAIFRCSRTEFESWVTGVLPLARRLQNMAPAESSDGPNAEYPWPHAAPVEAPVSHTFAVWTDLTGTESGASLLAFVKQAIAEFPSYA